MISSSQRPLPDNTRHSQQTNIHAPGGIRTHNLSRLAAADLRPRPRGHWDRHIFISILSLFVALSLSLYPISFFLLSTSVSRLFLFSHFLLSFVSFLLSSLLYFHCTVSFFSFIIYLSVLFLPLLPLYSPIYGS